MNTLLSENDELEAYLCQSDGPINLAAAMDTYRVKRYNISEPAIFENRLIQGAFRYQKLNLSSAGELKIRNIGARPTVHTTPINDLPGSFECSDKDLTRIWRTGARTAQLTEIPKNTLPDFWVVSEEGSLVEALAPQSLVSAVGETSYDIAVDVKLLTGAFTIGVLQDTLNIGIQLVCDLAAGSIKVLADGAEIEHAGIEASHPTDWISVVAHVDGPKLELSVDNTTIFSSTQDRFTYGSFGLGAPFTHSAMFRNLVATDLTGRTIYSSSLTDREFLDDFLMGNNPLDTIIDGSRRDRAAYNGDLDISVAVTFASTYGLEFVKGSFDLLGSLQLAIGPFVPTAKIQQGPFPSKVPGDRTGLIGYSYNLVTAMAYAHFMTGDAELAKKWAPSITSLFDWTHSKLEDGLFTLDDASLVGDWNYYDPPQTGASAKFNTVYAYALQQCVELLKAADVDTAVYETRLVDLRAAINQRLWSPELGAYVVSTEVTDGFAQDAQALAILAGVPQSQNISAKALLATMERELLLPAGPLAFSNHTAKDGFAQKISPYASGYHLRAAFDTGDGEAALKLLNSLWASMANPSNANYTNCMWETLNPDGTPGLGVGTSLSHGWGAGPTAELNRFVLGVQPVSAGFEKWSVKPQTLGLKSAKGRQPSPRGDINVKWSFNSKNLLRMEVDGPDNGQVYLPEPLPVNTSCSTFKLNGKKVSAEDFPITVSGKARITQNSARCS